MCFTYVFLLFFSLLHLFGGGADRLFFSFFFCQAPFFLFFIYWFFLRTFLSVFSFFLSFHVFSLFYVGFSWVFFYFCSFFLSFILSFFFCFSCLPLFFSLLPSSVLYFYSYVTATQNLFCLVGWGCRIHWLHLCRGVDPPPLTSVLDMTLNNLIVKFQQCWSFREYGVPLHYHLSQVHSRPEW